eukprot:scaffold123152_cov45-Phaeocystis_antarctica.AAC.1
MPLSTGIWQRGGEAGGGGTRAASSSYETRICAVSAAADRPSVAPSRPSVPSLPLPKRTFCFAAANSASVSTPSLCNCASLASSSAVACGDASMMLTTREGRASGSSLSARFTWTG